MCNKPFVKRLRRLFLCINVNIRIKVPNLNVFQKPKHESKNTGSLRDKRTQVYTCTFNNSNIIWLCLKKTKRETNKQTAIKRRNVTLAFIKLYLYNTPMNKVIKCTINTTVIFTTIMY